jgi:hypothetical protein
MDRSQVELLPRIILEDRRREASRRALLAAAAGPGRGTQTAARFGRLLVSLGARMERRASRPVLAPPPNVTREACDCAL